MVISQKISLDVLKSDKKSGGAGLCDLKRKDESLKCSWVMLLMTGMYSQELVYKCLNNTLGANIWCCNLSPNDVDAVCLIK